jgi:hypothetical protein
MRSTLAEIAATLVGFSVIFGAFTGLRDTDGHSRVRVTAIAETGLVVVALCFFPELLVGWGLPEPTSLRALSALTAIYWLRWLWEGYQIRGATHQTPILFKVAVFLHVVVLTCSAANALLVASDALYTTAVFVALAIVGVNFLAEFRVERG